MLIALLIAAVYFAGKSTGPPPAAGGAGPAPAAAGLGRVGVSPVYGMVPDDYDEPTGNYYPDESSDV